MNKVEEFVYHLLYRTPKLKIAARNLYQSFCDLLPRPKEFFEGDVSFKEGYFYGFHDVNAFSRDETKVLANEEFFDKRMPKAGEKLGVGYFDFFDGKLGDYHRVDISYAWNWHKGCRLQWLGDNEIIFNTAVGNKVVSEIVNVESKEKRYVRYPIDTVLGKERIALSFSYDRLQYCMPGYGYPYGDEDAMLENDSPEKSGLFLINLETEERVLLFSLKQLAEQTPEEFRTGYVHYVTHTEFSPDGRYISFLHRWIGRTGTNLKRWTRMMVYDRTERKLIELPTQFSGSHYVWNKNNQLLGSFIINKKSYHIIFDMRNIENYTIICGEVLNQDGHQSFVGDDKFVTDTYPDKRRMAKLYMVDVLNNEAKVIASTYSPKAFQSNAKQGHIACDLHPTVSESGKYVCFDCPRTGRRGLYVLRLSRI